jgi:hypothetical protein
VIICASLPVIYPWFSKFLPKRWKNIPASAGRGRFLQNPIRTFGSSGRRGKMGLYRLEDTVDRDNYSLPLRSICRAEKEHSDNILPSIVADKRTIPLDSVMAGTVSHCDISGVARSEHSCGDGSEIELAYSVPF